MLTATRVQRLARRVPALATARNDAELAAIAWACEMTALEASAGEMDDRHVEWADFDQMLADMPQALGRVADHFGFRADNESLAAIASGPLMSRYSKALEHDYSANLRRELIAEADRDHRPHIESALAMLDLAAEKSPLLARSLSRAHEQGR